MNAWVKAVSGLLVAALHSVSLAGFDAVKLTPGDQVPVIDGHLNDEIWRTAPIQSSFHTWSPRGASHPPVTSGVQLAYDDKYLYVGLRATDPDPASIVAPWVRRDLVGFEQDYFDLYIDPVGNGRFAQVFRISPKGLLTDGTFDENTGEIDFAQDFAFEGAAHVDGEGWNAEVRIPLSEIRYPEGGTAWTMLVVRNYTRDQRWRLASAPLQWGNGCTLCKRDPIRQLDQVPAGWQASYVLTGLNRQTHSRGEGPAGNARASESTWTAGMDFKIRPHTSLIVDGTLHPDFTQVELDAPQLQGNKAFALYFDERRPFFVEGSDLLAIKTDGRHAPRLAIYTRSITDPQWGLRLTTRGESMESLLLTTLDRGGGSVLLPGPYGTGYARQPKSNVQVGRSRLSAGALELGVFGTRRDYRESGTNLVAGSELTASLFGGGRVHLRWLESSTTAIPDDAGELRRGPAQTGRTRRVQYEHFGDELDTIVWYEDATPQFRADTGFFSQNGFRSANVELTVRQGTPWGLSELNVLLIGGRTEDWQGRSMDVSTGLGLLARGTRDTALQLVVYPRHLRRTSELGPLHAVRHATLEVASLPPRFFTVLGAALDVGEQVDISNNRVTTGSTASLEAKMRPLERMEFEVQWQRQFLSNRGNREEQGPTLRDTSIQLLGIWHFSAQDFLRGLLTDGRTRRNPSSDLGSSSVPARERNRTRALTYGHRFDLRSTLYVGFTDQRARSNRPNSWSIDREVYIKLSWDL